MKAEGIKLKPKERKAIIDAISWKDEEAEKVIKKKDKNEIEYEVDVELRDYENIPLKQDIQKYFEEEVLPFVPDAWIDHSKTIKGYEISFTKIFYQYQPLRSVEEISKEIKILEEETDGLLKKIIL
jgi:type I restriction enzyme M protein